ncbi:MAG: 50S ribosomal protein L13 [Alphaproteobacteria bacterium]|nr:50S ribosomal protein L13 [Alphaproteobacteria bacterium]
MKTFSLRKEDVNKEWFVVDAQDVVLGRLAAIIATRIRGKHKPTYTPHVDCGDHIIVINADKVRMTGKKTADKVYYRHTGYPGGIKSATAGEVLSGKFPERVLKKAVERMLPKGPLGRQVFTNLRVYTESEHPHAAQNPQVLDVAAMNDKNKRSN